MNTRAELIQAFEDFQAGRLGTVPAEPPPGPRGALGAGDQPAVVGEDLADEGVVQPAEVVEQVGRAGSGPASGGRAGTPTWPGPRGRRGPRSAAGGRPWPGSGRPPRAAGPARPAAPAGPPSRRGAPRSGAGVPPGGQLAPVAAPAFLGHSARWVERVEGRPDPPLDLSGVGVAGVQVDPPRLQALQRPAPGDRADDRAHPALAAVAGHLAAARPGPHVEHVADHVLIARHGRALAGQGHGEAAEGGQLGQGLGALQASVGERRPPVVKNWSRTSARTSKDAGV